MGMSANQARFLSLTSRQVDLEYRMQQICHRRLRLASELEKVATKYNNAISDRKLFASDQTMYEKISLDNVQQLGYEVYDNNTGNIVNNIGVMNIPEAADPAATVISSTEQFLNLLDTGTFDLNGNYVLSGDIDLSDRTFTSAVISGDFTGTFDGQGYSISGMDIDATAGSTFVGFFAENSGTIKNLVIDDADISYNTPNAGYDWIGTLAAINNGTISNTAVTNSTITAGNNASIVGGLVGQLASGTIEYSYADTLLDFGSATGVNHVGGLVGDGSTGDINQSYSTGDIIAGDNSRQIAGFIGGSTGSQLTVNNSYTTSDITVGNNADMIAGFGTRVENATSTIRNSYTTSNITTGTGGTNIYGFAQGLVDANEVDASNYYSNGIGVDDPLSSAVASPSAATSSWNTTIWDLSGNTPTLTGTNDTNATLEERLRSGRYALVRDADNYTQSPIDIDGTNYEKVDWRTVATIDDDLYAANDVDAEAEYDSAIEKINSQDKKLQLEQSQVEIEHKAIITQKDAVKNIINKNIESSFKTFS